MLYVTTRNQRDALTVNHMLISGRGQAGGLFLPLHIPKLSDEELQRLCSMSFGQRVAELLNLFFGTKLTGWDIDFCIGRYPVRMETLPYRISMTEFWHNPQWCYKKVEENLLQLLNVQNAETGNWPAIAIRMALIAGILPECSENDGNSVDIAMVSGDFTVPISAWYLRRMGFPVGNMICCCNENKQLWDLLCHGQVRTDDAPLETFVTDADVTLPTNLERLIFGCAGETEVWRYLEACSAGSMYAVSDAVLDSLRQGLYVSVVSSDRVESCIPNVYNSHRYLLTPASALAYSGLMDYRSKTGITRPAMVLCDNSPVCELENLGKAMNLS